MYQPITYSLLVEKNACSEQLALFKEHFGEVKPIPLTKAVAAKFGSLFSIQWAAKHLLNKEYYVEYQKAIAPAWAEYNKVGHTAWEEYAKVNAPFWIKFKKAQAQAQAQAFVCIYKLGMKAS